MQGETLIAIVKFEQYSLYKKNRSMDPEEFHSHQELKKGKYIAIL